MRPPWSDTDAKLLKRLRHAAGLSQDVLAKRLVLSLAQVRELEGEDQGRFYSEQIKSYVGQRLLAHLGHVPDQDMAAPDAQPEAAVAAPAEPRRAAADDPATRALSTPASTPTSTPTSTPAPLPLRAAETAVPAPAVASAARAPAAGASASSWRWLWVLAGMAVLAYLLVGLLRGQPQPVMQAVPVAAPAPAPVPVPAPEPQAASAAEAAKPVAVPEPPAAVPAAPAAPAAQPAAVAAAASGVACNFGAPASATAYQSPAATRPSAYVYFEARADLQVCVRDAQGKESAFELGSGGARNIAGTPPYTVRVSDWSQARVFFEGSQVRLEGQTLSGTVLLKPFQAP